MAQAMKTIHTKTVALWVACAIFIVMSTLHAEFLNPGNYDNGNQLVLHLDGTLGTNAGTGLAVAPPSDVPALGTYVAAEWTGTSNILGELHEMRLQQVRMQRMLLWSIGAIFGFMVMERLFRNA